MRGQSDRDKARFGIPEAAFGAQGYAGFGGDGLRVPQSNYRKTKAQIFEGRDEKARALADNCKPRDPEGEGGCLFPRGVAYRKPGGDAYGFQLLPCGRCKTCHERALRHETALIMSEVHTSDYSAFLTLTNADPADDAVLQAEAEADIWDLSLPPRERQWRVRNRAERAKRRDDRAHVDLIVDHVREYVARLVAAGRKQGLVAVQAYRRAEIARLLAEVMALHPRRSDETIRAFKRRVASVRRAVRAEFYSDAARADRYWTEQEIMRKEGFTVRAWRVGQYGSKTDRPHFHLIVCFTGSRPKHWPHPVGRKEKFDFVHDLQWPHGHMQIDWDVTEATARYLGRYMLTGVGKPRGVTVECPFPRYAQARVIDPKTGKSIRPGYFQRPRKGGHEYARRLALRWAASGLFPADFRFEVTGCRDQRAVYRVIGSARSPGGDDRRAVKVHGGRASIMSGSRRRLALETLADEWGIDPRELADFADNRGDAFLQQSIEKVVLWFEQKAARRDAFERADNAAYLVGRVADRKGVSGGFGVAPVADRVPGLSDARQRAAALASVGVSRVLVNAEEKRLSEALARDLVADERDFYRIRSADADELARRLSGQRVRALMPSHRVVSSPDQVAAYAAQVALAASGQIVWDGVAWVDLRAPP